MTASYRSIDYRIRPAKHVERLMMCEAFRRLRFATIESYQYIGLGSVYFSDFALYHRALGIKHMISIEQAEHDKLRFNANLPFANIEMRWGKTEARLPEIDLSNRSIVWLDYDSPLNRSILDDVRSVATRISSGSVLAISVQAQPFRVVAGQPRANMDKLAESLGAERINPDSRDEELLGWGTAQQYRRILAEELQQVLSQRNGALPPHYRFQARQIFNFHYADNANMLTVGWVVVDEGQIPLFNSCDFEGLEFFRSGESAFRIDIPKLTPVEMRSLLAQMPLPVHTALNTGAMPSSDAGHFAKIYRFFPAVTFVDL